MQGSVVFFGSVSIATNTYAPMTETSRMGESLNSLRPRSERPKTDPTAATRISAQPNAANKSAFPQILSVGHMGVTDEGTLLSVK